MNIIIDVLRDPHNPIATASRHKAAVDPPTAAASPDLRAAVRAVTRYKRTLPLVGRKVCIVLGRRDECVYHVRPQCEDFICSTSTYLYSG